MLNKIKEGFVRSGFGALLPAAAQVEARSARQAQQEARESGSAAPLGSSKSSPALTGQHLAQVEWVAQAYGLKFTQREQNKGYTLDGRIQGKPVKFERGHPSRNYIRGMELRARAELDLPKEVGFLIVNRALKIGVHQQAQSGFADSMMSAVDAQQPEEVLWMNLFSEVPLPHAQERFVTDYAVLAEEHQHAQLMCQPELMKLLLTWPAYKPDNAFVLMLARGKLYMRMRFKDDTFVLEHAVQTFQTAANLALQNAPHFSL